MVSLCGLPVRIESVRALAGRLEGEPLGQKLERAVVNDNSIVALSFDERQRIVDALEHSPAGLSGLRTELSAQLKRHREQRAKLERTDRYREIEARRRATAAQQASGTNDDNGG
jgi:hypothetical protein